MEKKINLETATNYDLTQEELKKMYIALALSMYDHLRHPDYDEAKLLDLLRIDIKRLRTDAQLLKDQSPNNPRLQGIFMFFEYHNKALKQVTHELRNPSEQATED